MGLLLGVNHHHQYFLWLAVNELSLGCLWWGGIEVLQLLANMAHMNFNKDVYSRALIEMILLLEVNYVCRRG